MFTGWSVCDNSNDWGKTLKPEVSKGIFGAAARTEVTDPHTVQHEVISPRSGVSSEVLTASLVIWSPLKVFIFLHWSSNQSRSKESGLL